MTPPTTPPPAVRLDSVVVRFDGAPVLAGVDLTVAAGEITAVVGANGAGKSTLLDVIAGIRTPTSGRVSRAASCALVPQHTRISDLLPVTARDVVTIGAWGRGGARRRPGRRERAGVDEALELLDLGPLADHPFASLSGGQRQRVLLAQALARDAALLLLDEPTAAVDADNSARIRVALRHEAARGVAVVLVTHDPTSSAAADRVVRLRDGRIVSDRHGAPAAAR